MTDFNAHTDTDIAMALYGLNKADCDATVISRERNADKYIAARDALHRQRMIRDMHQLRLTNRQLAADKSATQAKARQDAINSVDEFHKVNLCPVLNQVGDPTPPLSDDMREFESMQRLVWALTA